MFRIFIVENVRGEKTLHLSGRLAGASVPEVRRACEAELASTSALALDLAAVQFIDRDGVALVRLLAGRGIRLCGTTPFIAALLSRAQNR